MKNDIYTAAISAYKAGYITLAELYAYLEKYDLDGLYRFKI